MIFLTNLLFLWSEQIYVVTKFKLFTVFSSIVLLSIIIDQLLASELVTETNHFNQVEENFINEIESNLFLELELDFTLMEQVTNVNQLKDVDPKDWAYQALRNLVGNYGCIAGYPDGTFQGNRTLTRYEFAAGLNACL